MKKAVLCAAALVFGTFAYAQVAGAPTASTPVPVLSTAAGANAGQSVQNGDDNKVRVRQAGELNTVYTEQDNGSDFGGNLARVRQTGNVNGNQGDSGEANAAEVRQSGGVNQSTIRQEGDFNNAVTLQGQNDDGSTGNKASIRQGIANQAESNMAAIEQDGSDNQASTLQIVDNSDAWTRQVGTDNKSMIVQDAAPEDSDGHLAQNEQIGENNESFISQDGAGARNTARTFQDGDDNQAKQYQTTDAIAGETGNDAIIAQGNVTTGFTFASPWFDLQSVDDITAGSQSLGSVGGRALQVQSGSENTADIRQFGTDHPDGNYAEQNQSGSGNTAFTVQNLYGNPAGAANYARQDQEGTNSEAGISQRGFSHKAYQKQFGGDDNSALSTQQGEGNLLNIYQSGDSNAATSAQRGEANAALIVQNDGQSFIAQQNLGDSGMRGSNQIDAMQLGPNGNFHDAAIECGFDDPKDLDMNYDVPSFDLDPICPDC